MSWTRLSALARLYEARQEAADRLSEEREHVLRQYESGTRTYQDFERSDADYNASLLRVIEADFTRRYEYVELIEITGGWNLERVALSQMPVTQSGGE